MKGFKKFISVVSLTSSLLMGSVSVQGGNFLSLAKHSGTKLKPVYLVCILNRMRIPEGDFELKTLQNFEQVSKSAAEAMKMVRRFDFNSIDFKGIVGPQDVIGYEKTTKNILKLYPNAETIGCSDYQLRIFSHDFHRPYSIIPALKDKGVVKHLDVWNHMSFVPDSLESVEERFLSSSNVDFGGMEIYCHGRAGWLLKNIEYLDVVLKYLKNPDVMLTGCIYCRFSKENSPFLAQIQHHCPNVKIFELDDYFKKLGEKINEQDKKPYCLFYIKYKINK